MQFVPEDFSRHVAATHEVAHAIASLAVQRPVYAIVVGDNGSGHFYATPTSEHPKEKSREWSEIFCGREVDADDPFYLDCVVVDYAGGAAQLRLRGCESLQGCDTDRKNADALLSAICRSEEKKRALQRKAIEKATAIVAEYWPQIVGLGLRLFYLRRLEKPEIISVLRRSAAGRRLLGEKDPSRPQPIITREITFSAPLQKFAVLTADGGCRLFDEHDEALRDRSEPQDGIRYRTSMLFAAGQANDLG
jgi:hypothetical protein